MRCIAVAWLLLGACAGREPMSFARTASILPGAERSAAGSAPVTFAPVGAAAASYNEAPLPAVPPTPFGDAVIAATRDAAQRAGLPVPVADARLFRACADLAEIVPEHRRPGATLDSEMIEFALHRNGLIEAEARLLFGWGDVASPARFVEQLQPRLTELLRDSAALRFGVGIAQRKPDGFAAIVFALQASSISTLPIPRAVAARGDIAIDAVLDPRYRDPEVFVTRDDGRTRMLDVLPGRPGGFAAQIACDQRTGRQQIEITASDDTGATVLANFPVWCGAEPPPAVTVDPVQDDAEIDQPEQAERYLLDRINRERALAGLPALIWDGAVAAVARGYSEEMHRTHLVAHISQTTGSAADRVRAAHIATRVVLENVARVDGPHEAHEALMNSPGHRANLMSTEVTRIGIGVAFGEGRSGRRELFVTEVFTAAPGSPVVDIRPRSP